MTVEEILAALQAILDAATAEGNRDLTDEEVERYEQLEGQLEAAQRREGILQRHAGYIAPARTDLHAYVGGSAAPDNTLERAFEHYVRTGQQNQDLIELRAQGEGVGSQGGFLVPTEMRNRIVERMVAFGGIAEAVEVINTSTGGPLEWPTLDDTANSGAITGESDQFAGGADLVFGTASLGAYKYTSNGTGNDPLRVSVELTQDSNFDITGLISRALGTRIARAQAVHWAVGTGVGEPQGIAGASITENVDVDTHDTLTYTDLVDLEALLDPSYEQNARWAMSRATWAVVRKMTDDNGRPLVMAEAQSGIGTAPERQLLGYPVIIDQEMPDFPGAGNEKFIALGDWREAYVIRRVANLTLVVNPYSRANFGEIEYVAWERADGVVQNRNAYVLMANTAS